MDIDSGRFVSVKHSPLKLIQQSTRIRPHIDGPTPVEDHTNNRTMLFTQHIRQKRTSQNRRQKATVSTRGSPRIPAKARIDTCTCRDVESDTNNNTYQSSGMRGLRCASVVDGLQDSHWTVLFSAADDKRTLCACWDWTSQLKG